MNFEIIKISLPLDDLWTIWWWLWLQLPESGQLHCSCRRRSCSFLVYFLHSARPTFFSLQHLELIRLSMTQVLVNMGPAFNESGLSLTTRRYRRTKITYSLVKRFSYNTHSRKTSKFLWSFVPSLNSWDFLISCECSCAEVLTIKSAKETLWSDSLLNFCVFRTWLSCTGWIRVAVIITIILTTYYTFFCTFSLSQRSSFWTAFVTLCVWRMLANTSGISARGARPQCSCTCCYVTLCAGMLT